MERQLEQLNCQVQSVNGAVGLVEHIARHYLPWSAENKAAVTAAAQTRFLLARSAIPVDSSGALALDQETKKGAALAAPALILLFPKPVFG